MNSAFNTDPTAGLVNSLSERLAAAHKRNVEQQRYIAQAVEENTHAVDLRKLTAKEYAYASGIKLLEPLVLRVEELEQKLEWLREELVRQAAPKV